MKKSKLPKTDSIQKLAEFWDAHDLTELSCKRSPNPSLYVARRSKCQ